MEILILDNASTDNTIEIIKKELPAIRHSLFASNSNVGFWAGVEKLLPNAKGEYVIACTDAIMDPHFIERSIEVMEQDKSIGALQAKIYQIQKAVGSEQKAVIDTCGFKIEKSRRVTNLGHGEEDHGQYDAQREIFAVEGAVPVFRRSALEDCKMKELPTAHCPLHGWLIPIFASAPSATVTTWMSRGGCASLAGSKSLPQMLLPTTIVRPPKALQRRSLQACTAEPCGVV